MDEQLKKIDWYKISLVFLGILIVLGLFGNIYILLKKQNSPVTQLVPTPIPTQILATPTPDVTANWKIYTNEKYNISFKYPPGWRVELTGDEGADYYPIIFDEQNKENGFLVLKSCPQSNESNCLSFSDPKKEFKISEEKINNINWIKREHPTWGVHFITTYPDLNCCLTFRSSSASVRNYILNLILSTFNFLDNSSDISGKFCGGIAANLPENQCPTGYYCQLEGNYPDASGVCVKR